MRSGVDLIPAIKNPGDARDFCIQWFEVIAEEFEWVEV